MKEGYKKTELGWIPEEWSIINVGSFVEIKSGVSPIKFEFIENGLYPYFKVDDLNYTSKYLSNSKLYFNNSKYGFMDTDMVVFPKRGASIFTNKIAITKNKCFYDTNIMGLKIKNGMNLEFLYYELKNIGLSKFADTSSIPQINNKHIEPLKIIMPTLKEQEKIAEILSTVDFQIDYTDELIEKTKELKKGLMQTLLTRGIGHSEFKKSEVGEIPVEWEVKSLLDISIGKGEYGIGASAKEYKEDEPRYLRISDIGDRGNILYNDIKSPNSDEIENYILNYGDIVFARTGNTTGKTYIYNSKDGCLIYAGFLIKFSINSKVCNIEYLRYIVQTKRYWDWINVMSTRSGQPGINSSEYANFKIQIPKLKEQKQISDILSSVDLQIDEYENKKAKLEELKKGLMQELLTGKIRVDI